MVRENDKQLYRFLEMFIENCILKDKSLLLKNEEDGINTDNINDCLKRIVDNAILDKKSFDKKITEQFKTASRQSKMVMLHALWLWAYSANDLTYYRKKSSALTLGFSEDELDLSFYKVNGFGSAGQYHKQNKYNEVVYILCLMKSLKENCTDETNVEKIKEKIESICLTAKYSDDQIEDNKDLYEKSKSCAMNNILLYLCHPERYERIASDSHKNSIVYAFSSICDEDIKNKNTDEKIYDIVQKIKELSNDEHFDFYEEKYCKVWNPEMTVSNFNEIQGLTFKKNIVLYGPPGTGKTHSANSIAESFIIQNIIKKDKSRVKEFISINNSNQDVLKRIRHLQLHSNYSYEDFIAGIVLENNQTIPRKGDFTKLCEEIENDNDKSPYLLILDEINRVDLSRLFGEAFSAIEYRNKEINLSVGNFKIKVPNNLYIIGTMNEIDFSLERLDFALRRRFLWFRYGYNDDSLNILINDKNKNLQLIINEEDIERFIDNVTDLNKAICKDKDLGSQYEIGHTFFAEIIDIASQFKGMSGYVNNIKLYKKGNSPVDVLWNISIKPMIDAFLGNLSENDKNEKIEEFKKVFLDK